jgi:excisionase family DNA binding protein
MNDTSYTDIKDRLPIMATPAQVAKVLNCSTQTVYKLNRTGQLCACKVGRSLRFTRLAVANFVDQNTTEFIGGDEN